MEWGRRKRQRVRLAQNGEVDGDGARLVAAGESGDGGEEEHDEEGDGVKFGHGIRGRLTTEKIAGEYG